jgi:hypothetical protein
MGPPKGVFSTDDNRWHHWSTHCCLHGTIAIWKHAFWGGSRITSTRCLARLPLCLGSRRGPGDSRGFKIEIRDLQAKLEDQRTGAGFPGLDLANEHLPGCFSARSLCPASAQQMDSSFPWQLGRGSKTLVAARKAHGPECKMSHQKTAGISGARRSGCASHAEGWHNSFACPWAVGTGSPLLAVVLITKGGSTLQERGMDVSRFPCLSVPIRCSAQNS